MNRYIDMWKKIFDYSGRISRRDYWLTALMTFVVTFAVSFVAGFISGLFLPKLFGVIYGLVMLASLAESLAMLSMGVRRLHDTNKSGWFMFISFVPMIGGIILLVFFCTKGDEAANNYGEPYTVQ